MNKGELNKIMIETFEKISLITEYIDEEDCARMCDKSLFSCDTCSQLEECYASAEIESNDETNLAFVEAIDYGGYESTEEFWNELLE